MIILDSSVTSRLSRKKKHNRRLTDYYEDYDTWANGEMTGYVVEKRCGECECWSTVEACWGYYSVKEAMEQGTATLETYRETTAYSLVTCEHDEDQSLLTSSPRGVSSEVSTHGGHDGYDED